MMYTSKEDMRNHRIGSLSKWLWCSILLLQLGCSTRLLRKPLPDPVLCQHYHRWIEEGVPQKPLKQLLAYWRDHYRDFANQHYLSFADYSQPASKKRFYLLDVQTGEVVQYHVSHGSGWQKQQTRGDPDRDGQLDRCHYRGDRTNMTRVGFFKTRQYYLSRRKDKRRKGKKGWPDLVLSQTEKRVNGLRLQGLSVTNAEALRKGVVMHEAYYNEGPVMGMSWGCPAFRPGEGAPVFEKISPNGLFYSYAPQCKKLSRKVVRKLRRWRRVCRRIPNN